MYYCNSRYYDPQMGRWLNSDDISYLDPVTLNGLNLYAYCGNNPVMYFDPTGHFWDIVLDIFFIVWDIYDLCTDEGYKDWKNWAALGLDIIFAVIPFVSGGGRQVVKIANASDDIGDIKKLTIVGETMNRVQDTSMIVGHFDDLYDGFKAYDKLSDLGKGGKALAEIGGKTSNAAWLYSKLRKGYTVLDIGIDIGRYRRSSSYIMERFILGIWKYRHFWKLLIHMI